MTLCGGCEGYVALESGEEAIAVAKRRLLRHFLQFRALIEDMWGILCAPWR